MAQIANINTQYLYALQDLNTELEQINTPATTDVRDHAIAEAVTWYTRRIARISIAIITANGTGLYAVPPDWSDQLSRIVFVETPPNNVPPQFISPDAWSYVRQENDTLFYLIQPNPSGTFRLAYTALHGATVALPSETLVGSINSSHEPIIGKKAASISATQFAVRYANSVANNLDAVNYRTKSQEWENAAKSLRDQVEREIKTAEIVFLKRSDPQSYFVGWRS